MDITLTNTTPIISDIVIEPPSTDSKTKVKLNSVCFITPVVLDKKDRYVTLNSTTDGGSAGDLSYTNDGSNQFEFRGETESNWNTSAAVTQRSRIPIEDWSSRAQYIDNVNKALAKAVLYGRSSPKLYPLNDSTKLNSAEGDLPDKTTHVAIFPQAGSDHSVGGSVVNPSDVALFLHVGDDNIYKIGDSLPSELVIIKLVTALTEDTAAFVKTSSGDVWYSSDNVADTQIIVSPITNAPEMQDDLTITSSDTLLFSPDMESRRIGKGYPRFNDAAIVDINLPFTKSANHKAEKGNSDGIGERVETAHSVCVVNKEMVHEMYSNREYDIHLEQDNTNAKFDIKARTLSGQSIQIDKLEGFMMSYRIKKRSFDLI